VSTVVPPDSFRAIGHRGAAGHAPENTIPSFAVARELGIEEVELEVQPSRDSVLIVFHDLTLENKTPLQGGVADHDARDLTRADIGSWFDTQHGGLEEFAGTPLATLDEVLHEFGDSFHFHIQIVGSSARLPRMTLEAVERRKLRNKVTLASFHSEQLRRARRLDPEVSTCLLVDDVDALTAAARSDPELGSLSAGELQRRRLDLAQGEGIGTVAFPARDLTRELVEGGRALGLTVRAWGIRDPADLDRVIESGAAAATLDHPEWVLDRRRGR